MIERLHRLYILDGSPSVYADLAREWERRDERWCGGVKHEPPMTLEELRDWAEVEFFEDGLRASIETGSYIREPVVYLRATHGPRRLALVGYAMLSVDGRPRYSAGDRVSNLADFCLNISVIANPHGLLRWDHSICHMEPGAMCWFDALRWSPVCLPQTIPSGSCTESC